MIHRTFLSLPIKPWSFSLGMHLFFFMSLVFISRNHFVDLGAVELDFAPLSNVAVQTKDSTDEEWQKPKRLVPLTAPLVRKTRPDVSSPLPGSEASPAGTGASEFRSMAQVSRLPRYKNQVKAVYTQAARHANIEGEVILQVDIDAAGAVKKVELIKGLGYGLDEAAITAMQQSTFIPAYSGEEPVPVSLPQHYRFEFEH